MRGKENFLIVSYEELKQVTIVLVLSTASQRRPHSLYFHPRLRVSFPPQSLALGRVLRNERSSLVFTVLLPFDPRKSCDLFLHVFFFVSFAILTSFLCTHTEYSGLSSHWQLVLEFPGAGHTQCYQ